ncbi:MAG: signal peptidase II [Clostridia bacterium]|nr:signal peptidase II [Clostridia bacterium]
MNLILYFVVAAFVVALDLVTKFLVKGSEVLMRGDVIDIIPGVFRFRYVENPGAAMGSFASSRWVFMIFSTIAIIAIAVYLVKYRKTINRLFGISMAMIMGGGIGNMYERLFNQNAAGQYVVTDFFDFHLFSFWKWVFNVADVAVCVGAGLVVLCLIIDLVKEYRAHKNAPEQDELVELDAIAEDEDDLRELTLLDGEEAEAEDTEQGE